MIVPRRQALGPMMGAAALFAPSEAVNAQSFPRRQITLIASFPPGGAIDTMGRMLAERMQDTLGQSVTVENVTGAVGSRARP